MNKIYESIGQNIPGDKYFLIKYKNEQGKSELKNNIEKHGGRISKEFNKVKAIRAKLNLDSIKELEEDENIDIIEPDYEVKSLEESSGQSAQSSEVVPWGIDKVNATKLHQQDILGKGINVAVFDTGIGKNDDLYVKGGVCCIDGSDYYNDDNSHGTHVAGIISSLINNRGIIGAAPGVNLYAVKVLDSNGSGNISSIINGIEWALDHNIQIINMSFGTKQYSQILEDEINLAYQNNILMVASAGNSGNESADTITYPAKYQNVIAVGAVDLQNKRASFSSVGPKLELVAPGVDINSTLDNNMYGYKSGTSMAAPHVAGIAALLWSKDQSASNVQIRNLLDYSAIGFGNKNYYGNGLVDASNALSMYSDFVGQNLKDNNKDSSNIVKIKKTKEWNQSQEDQLATKVEASGIQQNYVVESTHPYPNNYNNSWIVSKTGATNIRVHFTSIATETNYDYVTTSAGDRWTGTYTDAWSNWSGSSFITVSLTSDGSVTANGFSIDKIEYETNGGANDDYGNTIGTATTIQAGSQTSANINYAGDEDYFRFVPTTTSNYTINSTGSTDTWGYILDANGNQLNYNDDSNGTSNFSMTQVLTAGQVYYIKVRHYSSTGTGAYILCVSAPTVATPVASSITNNGSPTNNTIFTIYANNVTNVGSGGVKFPVWTSYNGQDDLKWYDGTYLGNNNWKVDVNISNHNNESGDYICHVYAADTSGSLVFLGATGVTVNKNDDYGNTIGTAATIQEYSQTSANINYAGDEDYFRFVPTLSKSYTFSTTGSTDTFGYILDANGNQLNSDDDGSKNGTSNFSMTQELMAGQVYYIRVRHYSSAGIGAYTLNISNSLRHNTQAALLFCGPVFYQPYTLEDIQNYREAGVNAFVLLGYSAYAKEKENEKSIGITAIEQSVINTANLILNVYGTNPKPKIYISTPSLNGVNLISKSEFDTINYGGFNTYVDYIKAGIGNQNFSGVYLNAESIYSSCSTGEVIDQSILDILNGVADHYYGYDVCWAPYYNSYFLINKMDPNLTRVHDKLKNLLNKVTLLTVQPGTYFAGAGNTNGITWVQNCITYHGIYTQPSPPGSDYTQPDTLVINSNGSVGPDMELDQHIVGDYTHYTWYKSYVDAFKTYGYSTPFIFYTGSKQDLSLTIPYIRYFYIWNSIPNYQPYPGGGY